MIAPSSRQSRPLWLTYGIPAAVIILLILIWHVPIRENNQSFQDQTDENSALPVQQKVHLLLPASNGEVDLCKTILTGAILGYPTPTLIAWHETFDNKGGLLGGGSHVAKISGVLEYLDAMDPSQDNELIFMMDAYDIWFQLPLEVLVNRYYSINREANERLSSRLGKAVDKEDIRQTIIFGAGKRCAPNQMHTIACYPIPESPLPDDIYGSNTDTVMGVNKYTSLKQRYLNSGYIIGPAKDMREMFRRAWEKVEAHKDHHDWDNGSGGSDFMYHGSDQSIFNIMLGEQEFTREVARRKHLSWSEKSRGLAKPKATYIEGTKIDDPLNPSFTHEPFEPEEDKNYEFGMGLDYFSHLGHQTVNTERDTQYLQYNESIEEQLKDRHSLFDCPSRVDGALPADLLTSTHPVDDLSWEEVSLFTNLCLNTIPVMIHHNGDKGARGWQWPMTWMQPHARALLAEILSNNDTSTETERPTGGARLPDGTSLTWDELCPVNYEKELFRDVE